MERVCLLLIISLMALQESASKSTFSDWRAPINNLTGNQWPWTWGVSTPQNFYDSLYNHFAPITNFQVDISDVPENSTVESVKDPNCGAVVVDEKVLKRIEDLQDLVDQLTTELGLGLQEDLAGQTAGTEDLEKKKKGQLRREVIRLGQVLADQTKKTEDLEKDLADQTKTTGDLEKDLADQTKKTEELEKELADQTKKTETQEKDLADQTKKTGDLEKSLELTNREVITLNKEVEAREAEVGKIKTEVNSIDGRLIKTEKREAVCGYKWNLSFDSPTTLTFDRVYDEVDSSGGEGTLAKNGYFKAGVAGTYLITLETAVALNSGRYLRGDLKLSSGNYQSDTHFIAENNHNDKLIEEQASASRYVRMSAGETLHISFMPKRGKVYIWATTMCVSLYSASG